MVSFFGDDRFGAADQSPVAETAAIQSEDAAIARLASGGYVVAYIVGRAVYVQRFDVDGAKQGPPSTLTSGGSTTNNSQPSIAGLTNGGYVVSWVDSSTHVSAQIFDATGVATTGVFGVGTPSNYQQQPSVTALANGDFAVAWTLNGSPSSIRAQVFHADGQAVSGEIIATTAPYSNSYYPQIAALAGGGFVLAWSGDFDSAGDGTIRAQAYDATGHVQGASVRVANIISYHANFYESVAALPSGGYVLTWTEAGDANGVTSKIVGQRYGTDGVGIGERFQVNSNSAYNAGQSTVAALDDGGFIVTWKLDVPGGGPNYFQTGDVQAQVFDSAGRRVGSEFLVNQTTANGQDLPIVTAFGTGDVAIVWHSFGANGTATLESRTLYSVTNGTVGPDTLTGTPGVDYIRGLDGDDSINGGGGNDQLFGGAGNDTIQGGDGDDTIDGGLGADILSGDAGNDRFVFSAVQSSLPAPTAIGSIDGGTGYDVLDLSTVGSVTLGTIETAPGTYGLGVYVGSQRFSITGVEKILLSSFSNLSINLPDNAGPLIEIRAGQGADSFQGAGNYAFYGEGGDDSFFLSGRFGQAATNGLIDGGTGLNTLTTNISFTVDLAAGTASAGSASYLIANIRNVIATSAGYSTTIWGDDAANVFSVQSYGNDGVAGVNFFGRGGDDTLTGSAGADMLDGGTGNDILDGGAGADSLVGGLGNDSYYVDQQADVVFENANEGTDTVISTGNFYLYANLENLTLAAGAGNIFGVGNDLANTILGNEGNNTLLGGGGADTIRAGAGVDIVYGEAGNDQLFGDAGNDFLAGGIGDDTIDGGTGGDSLYGEDGNDTLTGGSDFVLDQLVGGAGDDVLRGDSGLGDFDYLYGNAGNDSFYVDTPADLVFEQAGEGTDTVYARINGGGYYLYDNIENLVLLGNTPFGVGNALDNTLTGNATGNYLLGGGGNDVLNGKGGNDVLFGEGGSDTFVFERGTGGDVIGDFLAGTDKIDLSAVGFTSFAQVTAALGQNGTDSFITFGNGDFVVLNGVAMSSLQAGDFVFASTAATQAQAPEHDAGSATEAYDLAVVPLPWLNHGLHGWAAESLFL